MDNDEFARKKPFLCLNIINLIYYQQNWLNRIRRRSYLDVEKTFCVFDGLLMRFLKWGCSENERQLAKYIQRLTRLSSVKSQLFHFIHRDEKFKFILVKGLFICCRRSDSSRFWSMKRSREKICLITRCTKANVWVSIAVFCVPSGPVREGIKSPMTVTKPYVPSVIHHIVMTWKYFCRNVKIFNQDYLGANK